MLVSMCGCEGAGVSSCVQMFSMLLGSHTETNQFIIGCHAGNPSMHPNMQSEENSVFTTSV